MPGRHKQYLNQLIVSLFCLIVSAHTAYARGTTGADAWLGKWNDRALYQETPRVWDGWFIVFKDGNTYKIQTHTEGPDKTQILHISASRLEFLFNDKLGTHVTVTMSGRNSISGTVQQPNNKDLPRGRIEGYRDTSYEEARALSSASSYNPTTGITTSVIENPDGSRRRIWSKTWKDPDGTIHTVERDDIGNQSETITTPDGKTRVKQTDNYGNTIEMVRNDDGTITSIEKTADGYTIETTETINGSSSRITRDSEGNVVGSVTKYADGSVRIVDSKGVTTDMLAQADDGTRTIIKTDKRGNREISVKDSNGEVIAAQEERETPMEPGEAYYRDVLKGDDWENLPKSMKVKYAHSERSMRENEEMQALRDRQAAEAEAQKAEDAAWQAAQNKDLDKKLAQIEKERQEHLRRRDKLMKKQAHDTTQANLELKRMAAKAKTKEYQEKLDKALADGDQQEVKRIEKLMDEHHDSVMELFEPTEEEKAREDEYQQTRNEVRHEILRFARDAIGGTSAVDKAKRKIRQKAMQDSFGETAIRELTFTGAMANEVDDDIFDQRELGIQANNEVKSAQHYLERKDLTPDQRRAAEQMLENALLRRGHAARAIGLDVALVLAGATADVITMGAGGTAERAAAKITGKVLPKVAPRLRPKLSKGTEKTAVKPSQKVPSTRSRAAEAAEEAERPSAVKPSQEVPSTASRAAEAAEEVERPSALSHEERQAYHDARAQKQAVENWRKGIGSDGGSDILTMPEMEVGPPGSYSDHLTQAEINELFKDGIKRELTHEQIVQKADLIRTGRAPESTSHLLRGGAGAKIFGPGDARAGASSGETFGGATVIDEPQIQLLDEYGNVMTEEMLRQERRAGKELDAALKKSYGNEEMHPMHTLSSEAFDKVKNSKALTTGDINFSRKGVGALRRGGKAIRVKKDSLYKVHFIEGDARGLAVKFYKNGVEHLPSGEVDIMKGKNYIPLEDLEYLDKKTGEWVSFDE